MELKPDSSGGRSRAQSEHADGSGLSGSVWAHEAVDGTGRDYQRYAIGCIERTKPFNQEIDLEHGFPSGALSGMTVRLDPEKFVSV